MKPFLKLKSVTETLEIINGFQPLEAESVALDNACGRRLANAFFAPANLPGFARSTVDGYAARARDVFGASENSPALLTLARPCVMGADNSFELGEGEAAPIATGAMLPKGADCAVMIEHTRPVGDLVEIIRSQAPGDNMVAADEDAAAGREIMAAGKLLRPQEIGLLASFGVETVICPRKAKVAIISSGDEIIPVGAALAPGQIYDVNSHSLAALCRKENAMPQMRGIIRDDPGQLRAALAAVLPLADVVVVSGGSSAGMRDHTVEAFMALPDARLLAHGVAISPGKPFILATAGAKCMVGLPGHVSSALVCAIVFLIPLLRRLQGQREEEPQAVAPAILARNVASAQGRRDYIRCKLQKNGATLNAVPLTRSSAVLSVMVDADGLVVCPENSEGLAAGQAVDVFLI